MKKINSLRLGLTFAGCFLGAGYVSGQELWQFFGAFGKNGAWGLVIAILLLFAVGLLMLELNRITHIGEIDRLVVYFDSKVLRSAVTVLEMLFLFGVVVIMTAGVGALFTQLFGIPTWLGSALFALLVAGISLAGIEGMVKAFSATVPVLAAVTLVFGILSVSRNGVQLAPPTPSENPLMGSWIVAALTFAAYNLFGACAIIAPLGEHVKSPKAAGGGVALGAGLLFVIAASVLLSVSGDPSAVSAELPMLALAQNVGSGVGLIYGGLLLLAMFGTALSSLVGFVNMLGHKSRRIRDNRTVFTAICAVAAFLGSLFGFGDLIGVIYPLFGYLSSVFVVMLTVHYFHTDLP